MRLTFVTCALLLARVAEPCAQDLDRSQQVRIPSPPTVLVGHPRVIDGDSLMFSPPGATGGSVHVRLWGIDAPERMQTCDNGWPAGLIVADALQFLIRGDEVVCRQKAWDNKYRRPLAICSVRNTEINANLVENGLAWAYVHYTTDYQTQEIMARRKNFGVHAHRCTPPWEWRRLKPRGE